MKIESLTVGPVETNVYLLEQEDGSCLVCDPGDEAEYIADYLEKHALKASAILLTHGHFDHIGAVNALKDKLALPVYACAEEIRLLADPGLNCSVMTEESLSVSADRILHDLETVTLDGFSFQMLHTPGHTAGSCCYYFPAEKILISGDTLFCGSYGRTDLPTGSNADIAGSVVKLLSSLDPDTKVYPGHGPATDIAYERQYNMLSFLLKNKKD